MVVYDAIKLNPSTLRSYRVFDGFKRSGLKENLSHDRAKYKGKLSRKAKGRLIDSCRWLDFVCSEKRTIDVDGKKVEFRLTFVTLTLPSKQQHSDKVIKSKCLNQFLTEMRKNHGLKTYVWKAERQKNGNLHFHIAMDTGIAYDQLRDNWNRIINKLGYVDRFKQNNKTAEYANSTDIHSVKQVNDFSAYMAKYMSKDEEHAQPIEGRVWFISRNLSSIMTNTALPMDSRVSDEFGQLVKTLGEQSVTTKKGKCVERVRVSDYCTTVIVGFKELLQYGAGAIHELLTEVREVYKMIREGMQAPEAWRLYYTSLGFEQFLKQPAEKKQSKNEKYEQLCLL